jgi:hypothetical protein
MGGWEGAIEAGLGECIAQMIGALLFNERAEYPAKRVERCVSTGEDWRFLLLEGATVMIE